MLLNGKKATETTPNTDPTPAVSPILGYNLYASMHGEMLKPVRGANSANSTCVLGGSIEGSTCHSTKIIIHKTSF